MTRFRLNTFIEHEHAKRLDEISARKGVSKSSNVSAALASFQLAEGGDRREAAITRRLDHLSRQFGKLERDQNILIETLALYIRYYLSVVTPIPEAHQDAARAQGRARFEQFITQLARHVQRGGSLVRDLHDEIVPGESQFFHSEESANCDTTESHS
jgi:hypothetical protein